MKSINIVDNKFYRRMWKKYRKKDPKWGCKFKKTEQIQWYEEKCKYRLH